MRLTALFTAALLATAACADGTAPPISLTDEEVGQLFAELQSAIVDTTAFGARPASAANATTTTTVSTTADCLNGGTVKIAGSATGSETQATLDFTETFNSCAGETFTFGGALHMVLTLTAPNDSTLTIHETLTGDITATHEDGRTGNCHISLTVDITASGDDFNVSATGSICGKNAEVIISSVTAGANSMPFSNLSRLRRRAEQ